MSASEVMPDDAFDPCPECGLELIMHEVTAYGATLHPFDRVHLQFEGRICEEN
jgi:hypothetical protein